MSTSPATRSESTFHAQLVHLLPELRLRALRLSKSAHVADDLVQDTIERALRFETQYAANSNLRAWVYQILFSVFVTRYRRSGRDRKAMKAMAADGTAWTTPEPFARPDASLPLTRHTERCLASLPPGYKEALVLVDVHEQSYGDTANALGIPIGTVMSRLHRARRMLAETMTEPKAA